MDALIGELSKVIKKARVEENKKGVDLGNPQNNQCLKQEKIYKHNDDSMRVEHVIYESGTNCVHECVRPCGYVAPTDSKFKAKYDVNGKKILAREYSFKLDTFQAVSIDCLEIGESVLISAHTSAGKTCVAEYAIAMALKNNQRVVYTSPIKALSNQKYRDLRNSFGDGNVGLLTGDVTVNPLGSIMVMTTEILRSMLYRGSELVREIAWVIFDEIHYMRDKERGVVWEESIILLPDTVRLVFLSATIPNHLEFAEWICRTKHQPCHVVYTDYRPVPLQHFVFPAGGNGIYLVVDENKVFRQDNYSKALSTLKLSTEITASQKDLKKNSSKNQQRIDLESIIEMCQDRSYLPIIVFSFSKKDCELNALSLKNVDLSTEEEKESIEFIFNSALATLAEEDRKIPQVIGMLPLLRRGIGIHHGGLLPVVKEIVELLFGESFIKVLFSTETFSMGINMPAKTVIFTSLRKFDGNEYRIINSGEFIQMSGRAGRRGLDDRGITITMIDELADPWAIKSMLTGQPLRIDSQFYIGYNMLLNLLRLEGADPEYMINRSFSQFLKRKKTVSLTEEKKRIKEILEKYSIKNPQLKISNSSVNKKKNKSNSNFTNDNKSTLTGNFTVVSRKVEGIDDIYDSLQEKLIKPEFPTLKSLLFSYSYFFYLSGFNVVCNDVDSINLTDFYKKYNLASSLHSITIPGINEIVFEEKAIDKMINDFIKLSYNRFNIKSNEVNYEVDIILKSISDSKKLEENLIEIGSSLYKNLCELVELNRSIKSFVINSKVLHRFYSPGRLVFVRFPYIKREDVINFDKFDTGNNLNETNMEKNNVFFDYMFYPNSFFGFEDRQILDFGWGVVLSNPIHKNNKTNNGFVLQPLIDNEKGVNLGCDNIGNSKEHCDTNQYYLKILLDKRTLPKFVYNSILKELENIGDSISDSTNYFILNCSISTICDISTIRLNIPEFNTTPTNSNISILKSLEVSLVKVLNHLGSERVPLLNYYGEDIINIDSETPGSNVCSKLFRFKLLQKQILENSILIKNAPSLTLVLLFVCSHKKHLEKRIMNISNELCSNQYDSIMQRELAGMRKVLKRLDYINEDGIVQLKGRIACEISSSDELLITELLFNNVFFQELKIEYIVAILSSLLYDEKYQEPKLEDPILSTGYENIIEVAKMIVNISEESGLDIDIDQYLNKFRPQIMTVILKWSKGESFESTLENTSLYEGSVIRCLRRLEELLRQVASATKSIGNEDLENKLKEGISLIRRGIVFTPSLYL